MKLEPFKPIQKLSKFVMKENLPFHSDAVQAVGKIPKLMSKN